MILFLAFLMIPLIEIGLFIQVGGAIGLWPTLGIVVLTAVVGTILVRTQGAAALSRLQQSFQTLNDPSEPLAHGAMILVAGVLLLTPGFFTDAVGFALLAPPVRMAVIKYARSRMNVQSFQMGGGPGADTIDGTYEDVSPPRNPRTEPSGWTKSGDQD